MKRLILASASPQRRNILVHTGLKFRVIPSRTKELSTLTKGIVHLVKHNALIKAQDVAHREKNALVIGCDTVVYSAKKRLILKPKDLKEAKKNLKELMAAPHWVYSGIVVVDADSGKTIIDYERTKLFMKSLCAAYCMI